MKTGTIGVLCIIFVLLSIIALIIFLKSHNPNTDITGQLTYLVVNIYPHDTDAFTQGLLYDEGFLYESTGLNGKSSLRRVDLVSGEVLQIISLPNQYFGEGIASVDNSIVQLTYLSQIGFVYDQSSFEQLSNFTYPSQGWGLTFDGEYIIMSDGTDNLYSLDPETYQKIRQIKVRDGNTSVTKLNELEFVNGDIYANIFEQARIAVIEPQTGQVSAWIDLTGLYEKYSSWGVLNGIAYDAECNRFFVTGKNWPHLFEIKLVLDSS